jgi:photosystem II stability/assembly factor-like uncharacterized protein
VSRDGWHRFALHPPWNLIALTALFVPPSSSAQWILQPSGTTARLRGVSVVDQRVAWASGAEGTVIRTTDGGASWRRRPVPGGDICDFRDVAAFDESTAYVLSIGPGEQSRIYKSSDGGASWVESFRNRDLRGFLDALAFWNSSRGILQGDPVDGWFQIWITADGGMTWTQVAPQGMPSALAGEGAFAASGTCLVVQGETNAWLGTGGARTARVFRSVDRGRTWSASETPISAGTPSSGIFSLAFRDADHGVAVGGDYRRAEQGGHIVARTDDGGRTWTLPRGPGPGSFRSGVVYVPGAPSPTLVAVGPAGADVSDDDGQSWRPLGTLGFHAVGFASVTAGWAVGEDGRVACFTGSRKSLLAP